MALIHTLINVDLLTPLLNMYPRVRRNIFVYLSNTFRCATFYKDPLLVIHAVAQELGPQQIKRYCNNDDISELPRKRFSAKRIYCKTKAEESREHLQSFGNKFGIFFTS